MTRRGWALVAFLSDPAVMVAVGTLVVEVRTIIRLRRILAERAEFDAIVAREFQTP